MKESGVFGEGGEKQCKTGSLVDWERKGEEISKDFYLELAKAREKGVEDKTDRGRGSEALAAVERRVSQNQPTRYTPPYLYSDAVAEHRIGRDRHT